MKLKLSHCQRVLHGNACMSDFDQMREVFHKVVWWHFSCVVDKFIMAWCQMSSGFRVPKIVNTGSFLNELFEI